MGKLIYLDNAATTRTAPEVVEAMLPYFSELYGNPSSIYDFAARSKEAVMKARGRTFWGQRRRIFILPPVAPSRTTGL